jgi:hypothetical protein
MGAGILPTTIYKNKLYFLFGKENKYEDSAPGFSDFGGGKDDNELLFDTAIREGGEELTGFLGSDEDLKKMLNKTGTYNIDILSKEGKITYRTHIFPMMYDDKLPFYYNNNQRFIQKRLDPNVIKNSKIFEKEEIRWICVDDLLKIKKQFRFFYIPTIERLTKERKNIKKFIIKGLSTNRKKGTRRSGIVNNKTRKTRYVSLS